MNKPLFIPLKTAHYNAFDNGSKREELRRYGNRWNEIICRIGRPVTLSKGYGKQNRMQGTITGFKRQHGSTFGSTYKAAILDCYGTLDIWIACITIHIDRDEPDIPQIVCAGCGNKTTIERAVCFRCMP